MAPLLLALFFFALLHGPGLRRWPGGPRPADKAAGALGLALLVTGWMHLARPEPFLQMMPPYLPWHAELVLAAGIAEIAIALGLLTPRTRRLAGWGAVLLFLALWPANLHVAWSGAYPEGFSQSPLYHGLRVPFQLLYVLWGFWCALGRFPGRRWRRRLFARFYDRAQVKHDAYLAERKRALLGELSGKVLEIGPGTGANFPYLDPSVSWTGIEPSPAMRELLRAKAEQHGFEPSFRDFVGHRLALEDASVDVVLSTLVLCSVPDPRGLLAEVRRVLRPDGRFVFLEHVAAPSGTRLRRVQDLLCPLWEFLADGCQPNRELADQIRSAGFRSLELEEFRVPKEAAVQVVAPHIAGVARR